MTPRTTSVPMPMTGAPAGPSGPAGAVAAAGAVAVGKPRTPTPRRLRLFAVLLVPLAALLAAATWIRVDQAGREADVLRDRRLPAVVALEQVAAALTEADRAAGRELVSGAFPLTGPGTDYQDAVKTAGQALADARDNLGPGSAARLRAVDGLIVEYTGLVGVAQSGREGPLAVAGIVYASDLLHAPDAGILVRLAELRDAELAEMHKTRDGYWTSQAAILPFAACAVGAFVLLLWASLYIRRRFRRHLNIPLLVALAAVLVLSGWNGANAARTAERMDSGAGGGTTRVTELWQARTAVQRVVGAETLALATRGVGADHRAAADAALARIAGPAVPDPETRRDATAMAAVVAELRARGYGPEPGPGADLTPRDPETVRRLAGGAPDSLAGLAAHADEELGSSAATARRTADRDLGQAAADQGLAVGGPVLCAVVLGAGLWGLWRRYDEYRTGG
ncbi:hypothetical protein [Yinghuangia soli]|uniref:Uncharacterized protein n=1 Tax=Yinghuangia soli TaxID=2908204 RepID=A0AA41TYG0_9ACTN|nr:hypothetical protein [Yinghuangia soli]MCF2526140.1 hypothetical protein [Yinghuangia soli]